MVSLTITHLRHGWAEIDIEAKNKSHTLSFESVPNDPLDALLQSALDILSFREVEIVIALHNRSEKSVLSIKKARNNTCLVLIDANTIDTTANQYVMAVIRMFDKYAFAFSKEEYGTNWCVPYPSEMLDRVRRRYRA
jgi:hypothetical protein